MRRFLIGLVALALLASPSFGASGLTVNGQQPLKLYTRTFVVSGSPHAFVVPSDVTNINVAKAVGGGGSGGGGQASAGTAGGGGGGSSNALLNLVLPVTPGETLTITIGAKGAVVAAGSNGAAGTATLISSGASTVGFAYPTNVTLGGTGGLVGAAGVGGAGGIPNPAGGITAAAGGASGTGAISQTRPPPFFPGTGGGGGGATAGAAAAGGGSLFAASNGGSTGGGGGGGSSPFGSSVTGPNAGVAGTDAPATSYGAGGPGGGTNASSGAGSDGFVMIQYWSAF